MYKATFDPQVWFNYYAMSVDPPGPTTWDCTAFVTNPPEWVPSDYFRELEENGNFLDVDDVLRNDPAAPEWIRDWEGPFTITVERV